MSRAGLRVVFPDGTVRCGIYSGTSDLCYPWLYDTDSQAWDDNPHWSSGRQPSVRTHDEPPVGEVFPVVIYSDYGGGFWWEGTAARNVIVDGIEPSNDHAGMPERVREFYAEQRRPVQP